MTEELLEEHIYNHLHKVQIVSSLPINKISLLQSFGMKIYGLFLEFSDSTKFKLIIEQIKY